MWNAKDKSSAPALSRGLAVLARLGDGRPRKLETLADELGLPKSSLCRLLDTLMAHGLVGRAPTSLEFYATAHVVRAEPGGQSFLERVTPALRRLAGESGQTAEWYVPAAEGMVLIRRVEPQGAESRVAARIGFVRQWQGELDAVAAVAWTWLKPEGTFQEQGFWAYVRHGQAEPLSAQQVGARLADAKDRGYAVDAIYNSNGVRRCACVAGQEGKAMGVLALAEPLVPDQRPVGAALDSLITEAKGLSRNIRFPFM